MVKIIADGIRQNPSRGTAVSLLPSILPQWYIDINSGVPDNGFCRRKERYLCVRFVSRCLLRGNAPAAVLAHEIGHACGLKDLYKQGEIEGYVSELKIGTRNWSGGEGTGFYPPTLLYSQVMYKAVMHNHFNCVIPLGFLRAIIKDSGGMQGAVSVGLDQMSTREPMH